MAGDILVAKATAALTWQGQTVFIQQGVTLARQGHPILDVAGAMFEPVHVHFDTEPPDQARTPEPQKADTSRAQETAEKTQQPNEPDSKTVRAWAADNGIEVPARGKIPDKVVEQYLAAQK